MLEERPIHCVHRSGSGFLLCGDLLVCLGLLGNLRKDNRNTRRGGVLLGLGWEPDMGLDLASGLIQAGQGLVVGLRLGLSLVGWWGEGG